MNNNLMSVNFKNLKCLVALLVAGLNGYFAYAYMQFTTPVVSAIVEANGFTDQAMIGMISTIPGITMIPGILFCGLLCKKINPKIMFAIGGLITAVFGLATGYCTSLPMMVFMRGVVGFGTGFNMMLINGMMPYIFKTENLPFVFGWTNTFGNVLGAGQAMLAAAVVTAFGWRSSFYLYLLSFVPVLLTFFFLPKISMSKEAVPVESETKEVSTHKSGSVHPLTYGLGIMGFLGWLTANLMWANVSVYLSDEGIGTLMQSGTASGLITLVACVAAMCVAPLYSKLRHYIMPLYMGLIAASALCFYMATNIALIYIGCALLGVWIGIMGPCLLSVSAEINSQENQALGQSIINIPIFIGMSLSPYWGSLLSAITGAEGFRLVYAGNAVFCVAVAVVLLVIFTMNKAKKAIAK